MIDAGRLLLFFPEHLRTRDVGGLLRSMLDSGDWSQIPLLLDAMQDAGATEEELRLPFQVRDYVLTITAFANGFRAAADAARGMADALLPAFRAVGELSPRILGILRDAGVAEFELTQPSPPCDEPRQSSVGSPPP